MHRPSEAEKHKPVAALAGRYRQGDELLAFLKAL